MTTHEAQIESSKIHTITIHGNGGEVVIGTISPGTYEYFKNNSIDIFEYSYDIHAVSVPTEFQPYAPHNWLECNDIAHEHGAEMDEKSFIEVRNSEGETIWSSAMSPDVLEEAGCNVDCVNECMVEDLSPETTVFYGQSDMKGTFFEKEIDLKVPFDPSKLSIMYSEIEGWYLFSGISYNGDELEDDGGFYVEGEDVIFTFIKVLKDNETEIYEGPEDYDEEPGYQY